ncbi:hypothetical protein SPBR_07174 [Sporothrix brasiliensis 5110]|uniref:Uncharacterized protein n=1 Tax=Sporothrix brasiliensis 5110 TaxID=1398154 RepID=A0A0C2IT33_9PEZI|nr:uncharacterized protein SPBR_07174 [Sporothrix brasiliensis 5110]KIH88137.1 hypothetical protein SPBR_07174 [Sporothrix brasiliensis 5110]
MASKPNPRTPSEWARAARSERLDPDSVTPFVRTYKSASVLKYAEFLNLKVLWDERGFKEFKIGDFVHEDIKIEAGRIDFTVLQRNVSTVRDDDPHPKVPFRTGNFPPPNGLFTTFQYFTYLTVLCKGQTVRASPKISRPERQRNQVTYDDSIPDISLLSLGDSPRTPSNWTPPEIDEVDTPYIGQQPPRTEYEATVNMGLITMLCAVRLHCPSLAEGHWLPDPKPFYLHDPTADGSPVLFQARVDGFLSKTGDFGTALAIVEVKPYPRDKGHRRTIEWQEAAQMAAWVSETRSSRKGTLSSPPGVRRRFMISQDYNEIYVTVAEYDANYQDYISGPSRSDSPHDTHSLMRGHQPMHLGTKEKESRQIKEGIPEATGTRAQASPAPTVQPLPSVQSTTNRRVLDSPQLLPVGALPNPFEVLLRLAAGRLRTTTHQVPLRLLCIRTVDSYR